MSEHIYHYNVHSEQRYFVGPEHRDLYDLIFLNGNIVSHTPAGIAAFHGKTSFNQIQAARLQQVRILDET